VNALLDTGAAVSLIRSDILENIPKRHVRRFPTTQLFRGANNSTFKALSIVMITISIPDPGKNVKGRLRPKLCDKKIIVTMFEVETCVHQCLLGRDLISYFGFIHGFGTPGVNNAKLYQAAPDCKKTKCGWYQDPVPSNFSMNIASTSIVYIPSVDAKRHFGLRKNICNQIMQDRVYGKFIVLSHLPNSFHQYNARNFVYISLDPSRDPNLIRKLFVSQDFATCTYIKPKHDKYKRSLDEFVTLTDKSIRKRNGTRIPYVNYYSDDDHVLQGDTIPWDMMVYTFTPNSLNKYKKEWEKVRKKLNEARRTKRKNTQI